MTNEASSEGTLSGLTVLDFTVSLSGPYCTMMLADNGARVIKIEHPGTGDGIRQSPPFNKDGVSLFYLTVNRGKESIALNLKDPDAIVLVKKMIPKVDILVENFRPGVMNRLGLGYEDFQKIKPSLIYTSISGFGQTGPMCFDAAFDTVIQGASGLMSLTGDPDGHPVRVGNHIGDISSGLFAYAATLTALHVRDKTGKGSHVDQSMLDGLLSMMPSEIAKYTGTGEIPKRVGNIDPSAAPFGVYETQDRNIIICVGGEKLWQTFCVCMGLSNLLTDERFKDNPSRVKNRPVLRKIVEEKFTKKPAEYWMKLLKGAGLPCSLVNNIAEACTMPQVTARNMLPTIGGIRLLGNPIKISGFPDPKVRDGAPDLDAHGDLIRKEFA